MMDTVMSPLFDPQIESIFCTLFITTLLFSLLFVFFILVALRVDDIVQWPWYQIWIPSWIFHFILLCTFFRLPVKNETKNQRSRYRPLLWTLYLLLIVLFQTLVVLELDSKIKWAAYQLFSPLFLMELIHFILLVFSSVVGYFALVSMKENKLRIMNFLFGQFWLTISRMVFIVLVVLRIDLILQCSWAVIFIPLYLVGLKYAIGLIFQYRIYSNLPQREVAHQGKLTVICGMLVFMSFLLCCSGCCLPCLLKLSVIPNLDYEKPHSIDCTRRITAP
ncbi:hypothetical protein BY458DRAFT_535591 [Sporodiniella umbellata]|nr:hypothetical protein BY458DRAFT_535591 [Sporodiniella umbellata]